MRMMKSSIKDFNTMKFIGNGIERNLFSGEHCCNIMTVWDMLAIVYSDLTNNIKISYYCMYFWSVDWERGTCIFVLKME